MGKRIRVGVLGHWGGNIGHEVMALGVERILKEAFGDNFELLPIEQHRPLDIYPKWHPLRYAVLLNHGRGGRAMRPIKRLINRHNISTLLWQHSWVGTLDLGIACGGPLITPHLSRGDLGLMHHHMFGAFASKGLPLLNLSVGSCYPWENLPEALTDQANIDFLKRVFEYSSVTTVRDRLAQRLCASIGEQCELVLDTGFVAGKEFSRLAESCVEQRTIVINYQKYGANEDWGQNVDPEIWRNTVRNLLDRMRRRHPVVFICHNENEFRWAEKMDTKVPRYQPKTMQEYAQVISGAAAGISNRLHAGIALASIGVPTVAVGTDTRLGGLQAIGLPCFYVKEANAELLEETLETLVSHRRSEHERLVALRDKALSRYVEIVRNAVVR
jgi:hypothetical protein